MTAGPDIEADVAAALEAMRGVSAAAAHMWHPALVGAAVRLLMDWLTDTGQIDARDELHGIEAVNPHTGADTVRLGDLGEGDRRASAAPVVTVSRGPSSWDLSAHEQL